MARRGPAAVPSGMRSSSLVALCLAVGACGGDDGVTIDGDAFLFNGGTGLDGRVPGATVTLVEHPDRHVTTAADGHFQFTGFAEGDEATFELAYANHAIQTGTLTVGSAPIERVTFQVVHEAIYANIADMLGITPEPSKCQIVTTVTRVGKSLYDEGAHGEAGATVTISPPLAGEGPIYFNASVLPQRGLTETSEDGGVLFLQVPPGEYTLTATKTGVTFRPVRMKCRAGYLVNASPPWGLQAL